jgi:hypothetical protein
MDLVTSVYFYPTVFLFGHFAVLSLPEKKRDTPYTRQGDDGIDDAADQRILTTADPSDDIKLEEAYASPVERADNCENERNTI